MPALARREWVGSDWVLRLLVVGVVPVAVAAGLTLRVPVAAFPFLALLAACAISVRFGLVSLALLAPFDGYIPSLVIYRDVLAFDAVGLAVIGGQAVRGMRAPDRGAPTAALLALGALAVFQIVSLGPGNWLAATDNVARFLFLVVLVVAVAGASREREEWPVVAALVAGVALRFLLESRAFFGHPGFVFHPSFQFGAVTSNPNTLGGLGACVLPLACAAALTARTGRRRALLFAAIGLLSMGVLLSFSKGAWLSAAAGLGLLGAYLLRTWRLPLGRVLAWTMAAVIVAAAVPPVRALPGLMWERWTSHGSAISNQERYRYIETASTLMIEHPLRGVGLERFAEAYQRARGLTRGPEDPHNAYLMVGAELGVLALGCYLLYLGFVWASAYRRASPRRDPRHAAMGAGLAGAIAAMLVFQLFSAEPLTARAFWLIAALSLASIAPAPAAAARGFTA
jgi:O-antigen ligase